MFESIDSANLNVLYFVSQRKEKVKVLNELTASSAFQFYRVAGVVIINNLWNKSTLFVSWTILDYLMYIYPS
jgi:hypothetical protein